MRAWPSSTGQNPGKSGARQFRLSPIPVLLLASLHSLTENSLVASHSTKNKISVPGAWSLLSLGMFPPYSPPSQCSGQTSSPRKGQFPDFSLKVCLSSTQFLSCCYASFPQSSYHRPKITFLAYIFTVSVPACDIHDGGPSCPDTAGPSQAFKTHLLKTPLTQESESGSGTGRSWLETWRF